MDHIHVMRKGPINMEPLPLDSLSLDRFNRYLSWANNDKARAFKLYELNISLSERFYTALHVLEISLRNTIDSRMSEHFSIDWYGDEAIIKNSKQFQDMKQTCEQLAKRNPNYTKGDVMASLSFGFWTAFFGREYENLWRTCLVKIAKTRHGKNLSRKEFSHRLNFIRKFRNRIAHHEPILHLNPLAMHKETLMLIYYMSPSSHEWVGVHSTFEHVFLKSDYELII